MKKSKYKAVAEKFSTQTRLPFKNNVWSFVQILENQLGKELFRELSYTLKKMCDLED